MEGELGAGVRIVIALIVIGVIIALIFIILGFVRGTANSGIVTVQNAMDNMQLAAWDDYDQQVMTGQQVKAAAKLFEGKAAAVVIVNMKPNKYVLKTADSSKLFLKNGQDATLGSGAAGSQTTSTALTATALTALSDGLAVVTSGGAAATPATNWGWLGYNYNVVLAGAEMSANPADRRCYAIRFFYGGATDGEQDTTLSDILNTKPLPGIFRSGEGTNYVADMKVNADSSYVINSDYSQFNKSGTNQFIRTTAKYLVRLIKDTTGTIVGICAVQQS